MEINGLPAFPGHAAGSRGLLSLSGFPTPCTTGVRESDALWPVIQCGCPQASTGFSRGRIDDCPARIAPGLGKGACLSLLRCTLIFLFSTTQAACCAGTPCALVPCEWQRNVVKLMKDSTKTSRLIVEGNADTDLAIGAHLVTDRLGYTHHGVYAGSGKVVHYAGLSRSLRRGPVHEVTLAEFAQGRPVWVRQSPGARFAGVEAVQRAYSRLGEDRYRLISNNCEHFCMWCIYGESCSDQIEVWKSWANDVLAACRNAIRPLALRASRSVPVVRAASRFGFE